MRPFVSRVIAMVKAWGPDRCLTGAAGVLIALLLVQAARLALTGTLAWGLTQSLEETRAAPPKRDVAQAVDAYDTIMAKGVLGTGPGTGGGPQAQVFGILGSSALMGFAMADAKPYAVGADVPGGEKLVEIHPDTVVLEKDGKQRTAKVFLDLYDTAPPPSGPSGPKPEAGPPPPQAVAPAAVAESQQAGGMTIPEPAPTAPARRNYAGSRWQTSFGQVGLLENGTLTLNGEEVGTWSIDGDTIKVNAMGEEMQVEIRDGVVYFEGEALTEIQ